MMPSEGASSAEDSPQCTNIRCQKEATHEVLFAGITDEPRPYCEEHYRELKEIEAKEDELL